MYGYKKKVDMHFDEAIESVREELKKEGFGVLTEIDVQAILKKKIGVDVDRYTILGACNPDSAYKALQVEQDIGLLLPCNIIVYEKEGNTYVASILPTVAMRMSQNDKLTTTAAYIEQKLKKAMDHVQ